MFEQTRSLPEKEKSIVRMAMRLAAVFFFALGIGCIALPEQAGEFLGEKDGDFFITYALGAAMIFVSITDLIIAQLMFGTNSKQKDDELLK